MEMKKIAVFALGLLVTAAHAVVLPIPFFATPAPLREGFDTTLVGNYNTLPVFGPLGTMTRIGTGGPLTVQSFIGANTVPNIIFGNNADARITLIVPMRRFGGYFRSAVGGAFSPTATFKFYDAFNNPIGGMTLPMTSTFTWHGFITFPMWKRVEIYGAIPGYQGIVGIDSLRIRPF